VVLQRRKQRARDACFRILKPTEQSQSTGGDLMVMVTYRAVARKKMNQRKRARSERTNSSQYNSLKDCANR